MARDYPAPLVRVNKKITWHCPFAPKKHRQFDRASKTITWHCPFSFKEHKQHDCQSKLFTCSEDPSDPDAPMNYAILRELNGDTENQLGVLKFFELATTIYQVKEGQLDPSRSLQAF